MRRLLVYAGYILAVSASTTRAWAVDLKGADTLEQVTHDVVSLCGLTSTINYLGGGSAPAQQAMIAGTQQLAPMSRQLTGTACSATASQLLIGLDGISIMTSNQFFGDSIDETPAADDNCSDAINGGATISVPGCTTTDGCNTPGLYVLSDWKDVLALVYGGQRSLSCGDA